MPTTIELPDDLNKSLLAMKDVVEAVLDEEVSVDMCVRTVFSRGLDLMLADVIGAAEPEILLTSFQQLAARHPEDMYGYVAEMIRSGAAIQRDEAKQRFFGFGPPCEPD
jgi:hypothetical protein